MIIASDNTELLENTRFLKETIGERPIIKIEYINSMNQFILTGNKGITIGISYEKPPFKKTDRKRINMGWSTGSETWFEKALNNCLTANEWKNTSILIKMARKELIHDGVTCKIAYGRVASQKEKIRQYIIKKSFETGHPIPRHIEEEMSEKGKKI